MRDVEGEKCLGPLQLNESPLFTIIVLTLPLLFPDNHGRYFTVSLRKNSTAKHNCRKIVTF